MAKVYDVPTGDPNLIKAFLESLVADAKANGRLEDGGIVLRDADLEIVMGVYGDEESVFEDKTVVDDAALYLTPIIYEFVGLLEPENRYYDLPIKPGTMLWRLIHEQGGTRRPLFALNAVTIDYGGTWGEMIADPTPTCPTLEAMKVTPGQAIYFDAEKIQLQELDLRGLNMFEFTRLGSMMEMVMGRERTNPRPPDPAVEQICDGVMFYKSDVLGFMNLMLRGRALIALGFLAYLLITDNDLIFGNADARVLEKFLETLGLSPDILQWLRLDGFHTDSAAYRFSKAYLDQGKAYPFLIQYDYLIHDDMLRLCLDTWMAFA